MAHRFCTDTTTNNSIFDPNFGHFSRVIVDINLMAELRYNVLLERKGFVFFVELEYENILDFYEKRMIIGHDKSYCKKYPDNGEEAANQGETITS